MRIERMVIHTDGTAQPNPGPAAIGAVIKDGQGRVVVSISQSIGYATNNQAEYRAVIAALERAIELGAKQVEIYSDSQWLVKQISGGYRVKAKAIKPLYQQVKQLLSQLEGFTIAHISGDENIAANHLANAATK